jgi:3-methyladenine DNA glycosylase AlkD
MPTLTSVTAELKKKSSEKTRSTYVRHGNIADHVLGVSIADLKSIAKTIKGQQVLACQLYETGIFDAMYLAGLVADGSQLTAKQLQAWAENAADMPMISEYTIPWLAVENAKARDLAIKWVASKKEHVACSGWCTYVGIVTTSPDDALNLIEIEHLLDTIEKDISSSKNRVRSTMNRFLIAVGAHVEPLLKRAKQSARKIGNVSVDVGDTACKVPIATESIAKIEASGRIGQKRKTIRC